MTATSREIIRNFIQSRYLSNEDPSLLNDDLALIDTGIVDSLGLIHLVDFLELNFYIRVNASEADRDNFNSINSICQYLDTKLESSSKVVPD